MVSTSRKTKMRRSGDAGSKKTAKKTVAMKRGYKPPGTRGIVNIGNSCYINCILQCLSYALPLKNFFFENELSGMKGLSGALRDVVRELWQRNFRKQYVNPTRFKSELEKWKPVFEGDQPHDAHQMLGLLLLGLYEEGFIPVMDLFQCSVVNEYKCETCMVPCLTVIEHFWSINLPIPLDKQTVDISECFDMFSENGGWKVRDCIGCRSSKTCLKRSFIEEVPQVLVIVLNRYSYVTGNKLLTEVVFPFTLDISEYTTNTASSSKYKLFAVVNHSGSVNKGHYVAYCRNITSRGWMYFNDKEVKPALSKNVVSKLAYLLFYYNTEEMKPRKKLRGNRGTTRNCHCREN